MTDTIRNLLISLSAHMAYMQGQLEARHELDDPEDFYWHRESVLLRQKVTDALAHEPAVPEGREPASVTGQPSDEELLETLDKATATFPPRHPEAEGLNAVEYPLALELRKARAVLARWGTPAPAPPADGEVGELVDWLEETGHLEMQADAQEGLRYFRTAELLQRQAMVPVAVSEALIKAECALSDISEGEHNLISADALQWAECRCADTLAIIRPTMRQHKIRTSEWPPVSAHALPIPQQQETDNG